LRTAIGLCIENGKKYDHCLITRFDLLFSNNFSKSNINYGKLNIVSILERDEIICDNFYFMPFKLLKPFYNLVKRNIGKSFHQVRKDIEEISDIHFICNEYVPVHKLSFYKIVRTLD
jgi:hypothetical protein